MGPRLKAELRFGEVPGRTRSLEVPTRHGNVPCTVYRPPSGDAGTGVYVNLHGGGFVVEHPEQDDPWCRYLAAKAGVAVLNVDYAVAPQHRFPVAVEQAFDVVTWAARGEHDWDGSRLCVGGQSAGGSLASAAARLAWENGGPRIALQVLQYPPLDLVTHLRDKSSTVDKPVMRPWMSDVFDRAYVPDPAVRRDRLVSPAWGANAEGLAGIAPALIITCEFDRLREEAIRYAEALKAVGALAEHHDVPGTDHGYNILGFGTRAQTERTYDRIVDHVRRAVGVAGPTA
ncbi:alpha/beta hydrolase [Saccharopolyspora taberi]